MFLNFEDFFELTVYFMRQSNLFYKTLKETPKEASVFSHKLLLRGGFISQLVSGVYSFLPLGWRAMRKIENIIRGEMNRIGGQEVFLPSLHPKDLWVKTGRWTEMDDLYKLNDSENRSFVLGPTHEEVITPLAKKFVLTYRDLPFYLYQIQTKFRQEARAKSGLLRGREFIMKDLYSFHATERDLERYYEKVKAAYWRIFSRVGIKKKTYLTFASGGSFSKYSHEYQTLTDAGEDTIYICQNCGQAVNKEIKNITPHCPSCGGTKFEKAKAIEVGNIFQLKTKFSRVFDLHYTDKNGDKKLVMMGCYGIGLGRLMATIVEVNNDEKGIIWPKETAPFLIHLVSLAKNKKVVEFAEKVYKKLEDLGLEVLYDDRKGKSAGEKFAEADLIGLPYRVVVSEKTLKKKSVEVKRRDRKSSALMRLDKFLEALKKNF
ncbi:MAG TPA: hypothetical protein ENL27_01240 [Candidatus Parcubacteria bacterium]|nr:hypothetical protein [Candidatus Parcubacteria bacterium]